MIYDLRFLFRGEWTEARASVSAARSVHRLRTFLRHSNAALLRLVLVFMALTQNAELKTQNCEAQTAVEFNLREMTGRVQDRAITIKPVHNPIQNGTNIYWLPAAGFTLTTTNGVAVTNLVPNDYTVTIVGVPAGWTIAVPNTNVVVNAVQIATNLTTYAYTSPIPGVYQLVAGAGIGLSPTNGAGTVTVTATGGAGGGALAAGTNAVVWSSGGTNYVAGVTDTNVVNALIGAMTNSAGTANLNILGNAATASSANAVENAVTNGIVAVATNMTPTRGEISSTMMIFPCWALSEINSHVSRFCISGDGGRTFYEPFFNPVYHAALGNNCVNDNSLCYDIINDCWWMPYTADPTSDNGALSNKWGLAVFTNLWSGADVALITTFTNSARSWIDQGFYDTNGMLHVILQCGRGDSNTLWMYEQHPNDTTYTNWSTPALITGSYTNNFGYDFFLVNKDMADGTNYYILWKPGGGANSWSMGTSTSLLGPYSTIHTGDWAGWIAGVTNVAAEAPVLNRLPRGNWRLHFKTGTGGANSTYWYSDSASSDITGTSWSTPRYVFTTTNLAHGVMRIPSTAEQAKIWSQITMWRWQGNLSPHSRVMQDYSDVWTAGNQAVLKFTDQHDVQFPVDVGLGYFYGLGFALGGYRSGWNGIFGQDAQVGMVFQDVTGMRFQFGNVNTGAVDTVTMAIHSNGSIDTNALWIPSNNVTLGSGALTVGGSITNGPLAGAAGVARFDANGLLTNTTSASLLTSGTLPLAQLAAGVLTNNAQGWLTNAAAAGGALALNNGSATLATNASFTYGGVIYPSGSQGNQYAFQQVWITNSSASPIVLTVPAAWQLLTAPTGPLTITNASFAQLIVRANTGASGTNFSFIPAGTPLWNGSSAAGGTITGPAVLAWGSGAQTNSEFVNSGGNQFSNGWGMVTINNGYIVSTNTGVPALTGNTNGLGTTGTAVYTGGVTNDNCVVITLNFNGSGLNATALCTNSYVHWIAGVTNLVQVTPINLSHGASDLSAHTVYAVCYSNRFELWNTSAPSGGNSDMYLCTIIHPQ